jgi:hypothetical protein
MCASALPPTRLIFKSAMALPDSRRLPTVAWLCERGPERCFVPT